MYLLVSTFISLWYAETAGREERGAYHTYRGSTDEWGMILYIHLGVCDIAEVDDAGDEDKADATRENKLGVIYDFQDG